MDETSFKRILTTFTDSPADLDLHKGHLLIQLRDEIIEASISRRDGSIYVVDGGHEYTGLRWIIERVARLQLLGDRLLSYVEPEPWFVTPGANITDELELAALDDPTHSTDALRSLSELVSRDRVGTSAVVYLVSDAGEGKTTLINTLTRQQADLYKRKRASWLLLPISLGGRPFLRFDDVVAATLLNRFRFPLFFDSFIELARLGVIVPALDGFEEMFVESAAGDAASALGNLMNLLESSGTVLVAARQAYFDYKNLDTQARLYDALSGQSVSFSCVRIRRWTQTQFVDYARQRGLPSPEAAHRHLSTHLGVTHPLLTRAVLASRIVELALEEGSLDNVTSQLDAGATDYFAELIRPILRREAGKWVDKSGEPYKPLLSTDEHFGLLEALAREMWVGETAVVPIELLEYVAELFCSDRQKSATTTRQVLERIKQHALLVNQGNSTRGSYQFDHEEFYHYFLGRAVSLLLSSDDATGIKAAIRRSSLPQLSIDTAAILLRTRSGAVASAVDQANTICQTEPSASFVRENAGAIIIRLLNGIEDGQRTVKGLTFPRDSLDGRSFIDVQFVNCEFAESGIDEGGLRRVSFRGCRFDVLYVKSSQALKGILLTECQVRGVAPPGLTPRYDPLEIDKLLAGLTGKGLVSASGVSAQQSTERDEALRHTERILRRFLRATEINENIMRQATGHYANQFFREVLPDLERNGIVRRVRYLGSGQQGRYKLGRPLQDLSDALKRSEGHFQRFVDLAKAPDPAAEPPSHRVPSA